MSVSCRRTLPFLFSFAAILVFSVAAFADCDTDCDPYGSYCTQVCQVCTHYTQDGCDRWRNSTCGDESVACLQSGCTPNWVEQSRVTQGSYDGRSFTSCTHHLVQWVTTNDV